MYDIPFINQLPISSLRFAQDTDVLCDKAISYVVSGKGAYGNLFSSISVNNVD